MARPKKRKIESKTYFDEQKASELIKDPILYETYTKLAEKHYEDGSLFCEKDDGIMSSKAMHDLFHYAEAHKVNFLTLIASGKLKRKSKEIWHNLTDTQLQALLPYLNKYIFVEAKSFSDFKELLDFERSGFVVTDTKRLAYLLKELASNGFVSDRWQDVCERHNLFVTSKRTPLTAKRLSNDWRSWKAVEDNYQLEAEKPERYQSMQKNWQKIHTKIEEIKSLIKNL